MAGGRGGADTGDPDTFVVMVIVALIVALIILWYNFFIIAAVWKFVRLIEIAPFYWVPAWFPIYGGLEVKEAVHFLWDTPARHIHPDTIQQFDAIYPKWFSWLPALVLIGFGLKKQASTQNISERFDEESLLRRVAPLYPHLQKYVQVNPNDKPATYKRGSPDAYKYAGPMSEELFASLSPPNLLEEAAKENALLNAPIWDGQWGFDMDLAERAFDAQLDMGGAWQGVEKLPSLERRVFDSLEECVPLAEEEDLAVLSRYLICAAKRQKPDEATHYGDRHLYEVCVAEIERLRKKLPAKLRRKDDQAVEQELVSQAQGYDFLIKFYQNNETKAAIKKRRARRIMDDHAFVYTGFISLITEARRTRIISVAERFNYLKEKNRTLRYTLDSAGKRVALVEAAGIVAHWRVETQIGRPVSTPATQEAVRALHYALKLDEKTRMQNNASASAGAKSSDQGAKLKTRKTTRKAGSER